MRLRVSLRMLMVVVALAALCVGPFYRYVQTLRQRSREYDDLAKGAAVMSKSAKARAKLRRLTPEGKEAAQQEADGYAKRGEAYTRAASRPWTTVPFESPPPVPDGGPPAPFVFPPIRERPKPPGEMSEADEIAYRRQLVQDAKDLSEALKSRVGGRAARRGAAASGRAGQP